ncbi:CoA ester lyase, partial [bacterium]|nr:CoA ester lyase [bacterium]
MERLRRSMLFVPGSNEKMATKSLGIDADSLIIDLEDSVAPHVKKEAREFVKEFIKETDFGEKEVAVRINSLKTEYGNDDLNEIIQAQPHSLVIPKVEKGEELKELDLLMTQIEKRRNFPIEGVELMALIETPLGIINIDEIAVSTRRLTGLLFGAGDFTRETRGQITRERWELYYPLIKIVVAARAANIDAVDSPYFDVKDSEGCEVNARQAKILGYDGKSAIHPSQVEVINKVFTPTPEEIDRAKKVIEVYQRAEADGKGATQLNGQLIEHV